MAAAEAILTNCLE